MPRSAEVLHRIWIAAPVGTVRAQFADLHHHVAARVHPKLRFEIMQVEPRRARFVQEVKLLGMRQRDVFEREFKADGTMVDTSIEGFNKGGSLTFCFGPARQEGCDGTQVDITIRLPLPPLIGPLIRPLLERQVRKEVSAAALEDKHDIEVRGYRPSPSGEQRNRMAA